MEVVAKIATEFVIEFTIAVVTEVFTKIVNRLRYDL